MTRITPNNAIELLDSLLRQIKIKVDLAVDMTFGKGMDSRKILNLFPTRLIAFDVQDEAICHYGKSLKNNFPDRNITLIKDSHENISAYINSNIDLAIYNLGYLPGSDKKIHTNSDTTIKSLKSLLNILSHGAFVFITCYPGYQAGLYEFIEVERFLRALNQKQYAILKYEFINQVNNPPVLFSLERL